MHTNLEYTDENYDALCSTMYCDQTLLNAITGCFDADAKECLRILNLMCDDLAYTNSIEVTVGEAIYNLNNILKSFINNMENKIKDTNIDDIDIEKLSKFLNIINK
jgi:hypothetical protein